MLNGIQGSSRGTVIVATTAAWITFLGSATFSRTTTTRATLSMMMRMTRMVWMIPPVIIVSMVVFVPRRRMVRLTIVMVRRMRMVVMVSVHYISFWSIIIVVASNSFTFHVIVFPVHPGWSTAETARVMRMIRWTCTFINVYQWSVRW